MRIHSLPPAAPEPGLSRVAVACLVFDFLLLTLLCLYMSWSPDRYESTGPRVDLAVVRTILGEECGPGDRLIFSMTRDGRVWRLREPRDLNHFADELNRAVLAHDEQRRARGQGQTGFEEWPGGAHVSRLYLLLRIDRATPWGTVHAVIRRVGESSIYKMQFLVANDDRHRGSVSKLEAFLADKNRRYEYITARIRSAGGTVLFSLEGRDCPDFASLSEAIRSGRKSLENSDMAIAGLIDADADIPFENVVRALDAFASAGMYAHLAVSDRGESARAVVVPRR